ncbi:MAG: hypothetical protein FWD27_05305 [Coriobacteriia bacterium]|nr:hypothetical protein [Coriobacteriia bacterium]
MNTLQRVRSSSIQACKKMGLYGLVLAALLALTLLGGCAPQGASGAGSAIEQEQQLGSDDVDSGGFVIEDSAVVDVDIIDEGD